VQLEKERAPRGRTRSLATIVASLATNNVTVGKSLVMEEKAKDNQVLGVPARRRMRSFKENAITAGRVDTANLSAGISPAMEKEKEESPIRRTKARGMQPQWNKQNLNLLQKLVDLTFAPFRSNLLQGALRGERELQG
jgi:hypothetical protein